MPPRRKPVPLAPCPVPIFAEPERRTSCRGVPVYAYGYTNILAESPDLTDAEPLQIGNDSPRVKVHPKKSCEITSNRLGATAPRMPRTAANDYLPLEAINLIDGDPQTCWCSRTAPQADVEPAWIRLDLAVERTVAKIVLGKRPPGTPRCTDFSSMSLDAGAVEIGMAIPGQLTIRLSRDGLNWETVFDGPSGDTPERREFACTFAPRPAKQIWIIGRHLPRVENWLHSFSIAEAAVYDTSGENVALVTHGTGVTVSSTQHSMGQTRDEHRWLWPLHTDLGLKWVRIGYHDDPVNWHWVEKEKGKLAVDPEADMAVSYLVDRGVDIVLALGFGNRHYTQADPARRLPQLWEWYYENPAPPITAAALQAWGRYVRFMARHFRDRVKVFEVWNEWNIPVYWGAQPSLEHYLAVARVAIPILRRECPDAKIMLGSVAGFAHGMSTWTPEELARQERDSLLLGAVRELAREVDVIGWHPFYQADPDAASFRSYVDDVRGLKAWCATRGFGGEFMASEWTVGANYPPPTPPNWWGACTFSEIGKAKIVAQLSVLHTALGVGSFFCETWSNYYPLDLSLLRRAFAADPISPQQPQAAYYVMRNLATALEGLAPAEFAVEVSGVAGALKVFTMARPGERVIALWQPGRPLDNCPGTPCDVTVKGACPVAFGYDPLNGTLQELRSLSDGESTRISGIMVRDCPLLLHLPTPIAE